MGYVLATSRAWHKEMARRLQQYVNEEVVLITKKSELTFEYLEKLKPRYVFFPHWSYIIPPHVFENFECVIFHMTDLPFGRGGSPLQNLISRSINDTKITALRCVKELDAGPIYMKQPLSLYGTAEEIYLRAGRIVEEMIVRIIETKPEPIEQEGEAVVFKRRKPEQSNITGITGLEKLFDHIRMLDADGYPRAFLETDKFRFEFQRPALKSDKIIADVVITKVDHE